MSGPKQTDDEFQHHRLAATALANDPQCLSTLNFQVDGMKDALAAKLHGRLL
jgi:hypothetical protein